MGGTEAHHSGPGVLAPPPRTVLPVQTAMAGSTPFCLSSRNVAKASAHCCNSGWLGARRKDACSGSPAKKTGKEPAPHPQGRDRAQFLIIEKADRMGVQYFFVAVCRNVYSVVTARREGTFLEEIAGAHSYH